MNNNIKLKKMEETTKNTGQNLGIAALITAIVTFVIAVIPCIGLIAIIPGIIAIVLASVGLSNAAKSDSPRGVLLAGLIIAIVASLISFSQVFVVGKIADKAENWPHSIEKIMDEMQKDVLKDLEDANVSIRIENGDEKIEINAGAGKVEREKTLEELEGETESAADSVDTK